MQKSVNTHFTTDLQGEGSFVTVRRMKYGEKKQFKAVVREEFRKTAGELGEGPLEDRICGHVIAWNWTDEEGKTLPLPKDDPEVLDRLTEEEVLFLTQAIMGSVETDAKN
jgi:hypothetical protein